MTRLPPDVPRCAGLPPGTPCPAHDDGTWPEGCDCQVATTALGTPYATQPATVLVITGLIVAISVAAIAIFFVADRAFGADVDPDCMTHDQARAKHKTSHLYWHTSRHCWDNKAGRGTPPSPPRVVVMQPVPRPATIPAPGPMIAYPSLITGPGTDSEMLRAAAMTSWPMLEEPREFTPWQERIDLPAVGGK